jgi:hypothetical protein
MVRQLNIWLKDERESSGHWQAEGIAGGGGVKTPAWRAVTARKTMTMYVRWLCRNDITRVVLVANAAVVQFVKMPLMAEILV